jgi:hypothetical protein
MASAATAGLPSHSITAPFPRFGMRALICLRLLVLVTAVAAQPYPNSASGSDGKESSFRVDIDSASFTACPLREEKDFSGPPPPPPPPPPSLNKDDYFLHFAFAAYASVHFLRTFLFSSLKHSRLSRHSQPPLRLLPHAIPQVCVVSSQLSIPRSLAAGCSL